MRWIAVAVLAVAIVLVGTWCTLAIWFRFPGEEAASAVLAGGMGVLTICTIACLLSSWALIVTTSYLVAVASVLIWWATILPSNDHDWQPDVARTATATVYGDQLAIDNVRNFNWRSDTDFDQRWEHRTYDLSQLRAVDLILSYWAGEAIAHLIVSFGFADGQYLAFSIETRKQLGEAYSTVAGFFKQYEVILVAADERDVVRVRSNVRGEDVRIYRLRMQPQTARRLLLAYVNDMNELARQPRWYNTATANCTTLVFGMARALKPTLSLDYRILLSGYFPNYAYDIGAINTDLPFAQLRARSRVQDRAAQADADPDFSRAIRAGIPGVQ